MELKQIALTYHVILVVYDHWRGGGECQIRKSESGIWGFTGRDIEIAVLLCSLALCSGQATCESVPSK